MRPIFFFLTASVALNVAAMVSVDRAFLYEGQRLMILEQQKKLQEERNKLPFEFVESPQIKSEKPSSSKKMSNRDSLARDRNKDKSRDTAAPLIEKEGPADQLEQHRAKSVPTQRPSPAVRPQEEMKKSEASPKQQAPRQAKPAKAAPAPQEKLESAEKTPGREKAAIQEKMTAQEKAEEVRVPQPKPPAPSNPENRPKVMGREAQTGQRSYTGADRISTQAMIRSKARGASLTGATSFDAMGGDMGVYMKNLKEKIWLAWFPYLAFQYPADFQAADAVISMTLDAKGDVKMVKVLDSYGSPLFATFCTEAVQRASGFGPVPKEIRTLLGKDELEIKFAFHYR